jgi:Fur family transcriptional regulator, ferric uptake regulator
MPVQGKEEMTVPQQVSQTVFGRIGIRNTIPRKLVYAVLEDADLPISAEQVYWKLKEAVASVSLSTVYRILEIFVEKRLVLKSSMPEDNKAMFELNRPTHQHHLLCLACRKMLTVDGCPLDVYEHELEHTTKFHVTGHRLEILGYCETCNMKRKSEGRPCTGHDHCDSTGE